MTHRESELTRWVAPWSTEGGLGMAAARVGINLLAVISLMTGLGALGVETGFCYGPLAFYLLTVLVFQTGYHEKLE